jgi:hypothetical protein
MIPLLMLILAVPQGGAEFQRCDLCHTAQGWHELKAAVGGFDHDATGFSLRGAHRAPACNDCHGAKPLNGAECQQCHLDPHNKEKGPTCAECHGTQSWRIPQARLDHRKTRMPLVGRHAGVPCSDCHVRQTKDEWRAVPADCAGCHRSQVIGASLHPDHSQGRFSTGCEACHSVYGWRPARVVHDRFWPLTGAHRTVDCAQCHVDGRYAGTPRDCRGCHQTEFARAHSPTENQTCEACHSTRAWSDVQPVDHRRFFPLPHEGISDCNDCHPNGSSTFSCVTCHTHSQGEMDGEHRRVSGYSYDSMACFRCHPRGDD